MKQTVEHVVEPSALLLAWQAPDHLRNRRRWLVARIDVSDLEWHLTYLKGADFAVANPGASYDTLSSLGYCGYPAFALKHDQHDEGVRAAIMRRLPPRKRSDFGMFLEHFGLTQATALSDAALAAYTGAKVPSDGFSIAGEYDANLAIGDLVLEVAGTRHQMPADCKLTVGDRIEFEREPHNEQDPKAIAMYAQGCRIGYVNRLQADIFGYWLAHRHLDASVQRVNGKPGEPRVFAFIRVRPRTQNLAA